MSFFQDIFGGAKNILDKGKDALTEQLGSELTVRKTETGEVETVSDTGFKPKILSTSKEFFLPTRGFTEEQISEADPTFKETAIGAGKTVGEIGLGITALSRLGLSKLPGPVGDYYSSLESRQQFAEFQRKVEPTTAGQARVMRQADVAGLLPVGSIKHFGKLNKLDNLSDVAQNSLKNQNIGARDKALEFFRRNPGEVAKGEVRLREIEGGKIFIEDGRHRLQVGSELGVKPKIVDVTSEYTGKSSTKIANIIKDIGEEVPTVKKVTPKKVSPVKAVIEPRKVSDIQPRRVDEFERSFSKRVADSLPDAEGIGSTARVRNTARLSQKAQNLIKESPEAVQNIVDDIKVGQNMSDQNIAVASELLNQYRIEALSTKNIARRNELYDKAAELANDTARQLTEQGRSIQAATLYGKLTPEGQARFAARSIQNWNRNNPTKKIAELGGEQTKHITDEMAAINKLPEGDIKAMRQFELQRFIQDLTPTPTMKKITNVWKAGLLTGLKTSGLNISSNTAHQISEVLKDIPAAAVDRAASLFTGKRTKVATMRGAFDGVKEGTVKGARYFSTGFDERNIGQKLDYHRVNFGKGPVNKAFQAYSDTVFRTIGAQDQPYYYASLSRSLMDQALAKGKTQGLKGKELVNFAQDLVKSPTEEMIRYGTLDATTAVFQNKTKLGAAAKQIQNIPGVGQFIVPFAQTPSAVAMQILNYSPVGAVKTIIENIGKGKFDQRLFSQGIGRSIVGVAPLVIGAELYKNGMVSLDYPAGDERQIELDKERGVKYNALKIDDKWRSAITLGPAGNLVLMGAYYQKAIEEKGSPSEAMSTAGLGMINSFGEQTFLTGAKSFANAVTDPERYGKTYLPNLAASFIPTIVSDVARTKDPFEREATADTFAETFKTRAQARIPGAREGLPQQVTAFGTQRERGGTALETMLDPTRPSVDRSTELTTELQRLMDVGFRAAPTKLGTRAGYPSLTQEQEQQLFETVGGLVNSKLTALVANEKYQNMSDEDRLEIIEKFTDKAKTEGRARFILSTTSGLSPDEEKVLLGEYKEDKLLNKSVLTVYKKLRKGE